MIDTDLFIKLQQGYDSIIIVLIISVLMNIARKWIQNLLQNKLKDVVSIPENKRQNFSESMWKCIYYTIAWVWSVETVISQDFFWDTRLCWQNWPNIPMSVSFKWFYLVQMSFYLHSSVAHGTIEVKRTDFWEMLIHHVATFILVAFSYYHNVFRIGGLILTLHDFNDMFLEAAKMANYVKGKENLSNSLFAFMLFSWTITRMTLFPTKVLTSVYYEVFDYLPFSENWYYYVWSVFFFLLVVIQLLDIFWFFLICRIAYNATNADKKKVKDEREDD